MKILEEPPVDHPSEMEFDLALLEAPSPAFSQHVAGCDGCAEKWVDLQRDQTDFSKSTAPVRAAKIVLRKQRERSWSGRLLRFGLPSFGLAAATAGILLLVQPDPEGVRMKGMPSVDVYVKPAGGQAGRWDGRPLVNGDAVEFNLHPAGFSSVTVFSVDQRCAAKVEHSGAANAGVLPASWTLRGTDAERLYVVFSRGQISESQFSKQLKKTENGCDQHRAPQIVNPELIAHGFALRTGNSP